MKKEKVPCKYCGKPTGNKKMHEKYCDKNPNKQFKPLVNAALHTPIPLLKTDPYFTEEEKKDSKVVPACITISMEEEKENILIRAWHSVFPRKTGINLPDVKKLQKKPPIIIKSPDPNFKPDEKLSESERLKQFLADAPLWTQYRPQGIRRLLTKIFSPNKTFASMVFVGENRPPRVLYLPYDPEKNRVFIPGKAYHFTPTTGQPFFYHEDFMLPLVNTPKLEGRFQLPGHVVEFAYSSGLAEGVLQKAPELIEEIKKYKMVCYLLGAIVLVALVALIAVTYTYDHNYKAIAENMANLTAHLPPPSSTRIP